ncbi:MAG: HIT family protein [Gammaproteobacteria bacterium]|nr:MAG: HIT family protein [Gammaproteobacteria bacterium]RLA09339.1 MAG: HIT family protein [Gammaproteobacteria bacterium]RLA17513.1 MAG: HIT family protein [Gammaproteobacteria bacterium]
MDNGCIFCQIVAGTAPAAKVFEDDQTLAFLDINPINPGHCLVIPKTHHENLFTMDRHTYQAVASTTLLIAQAIQQSLQPAGMNIFQANGEEAGQTVFHLHNHILPRLENDNLRVEVHGMQTAKPDQLLSIAATIQTAVQS